VGLRVELSGIAMEEYAENDLALRHAVASPVDREIDLASAKTVRNPYFRKSWKAIQVAVYAA
jgi:hypothetical protein